MGRSLRVPPCINPGLALHYTDLALTPPVQGAEDHFVQRYADKLPHTHGAPPKPAQPVREIVAAE